MRERHLIGPSPNRLSQVHHSASNTASQVDQWRRPSIGQGRHPSIGEGCLSDGDIPARSARDVTPATAGDVTPASAGDATPSTAREVTPTVTPAAKSARYAAQATAEDSSAPARPVKPHRRQHPQQSPRTHLYHAGTKRPAPRPRKHHNPHRTQPPPAERGHSPTVPVYPIITHHWRLRQHCQERWTQADTLASGSHRPTPRRPPPLPSGAPPTVVSTGCRPGGSTGRSTFPGVRGEWTRPAPPLPRPASATGSATVSSREEVNHTSPPPGSSGSKSITDPDGWPPPPPRISLRFPPGDVPLPPGARLSHSCLPLSPPTILAT